MFTGIIEATGRIEDIRQEGTNLHFYISSPFTHELKIDQSVAHNGVCLTVVEITGNIYKVSAIEETLNKTNLSQAKAGDLVNLERCMPANGRFDGHIVQGHVDTTAVCTKMEDHNGSWILHFAIDRAEDYKGLIVQKGSVCMNGISLTVVDCDTASFSVAIIPYTYEFTNIHQFSTGTKVNIEFDILGKYVANMMKARGM